MRFYLSLLLSSVIFVGCQDSNRASFIKRELSANDIDTTIKKLQKELPKYGLITTHTLDEGKYANLLHRPKKVVYFTNPKASTDLMKCDSALALEVPYKIVVSTSYDGKTEVIYTNPEYWSLKYNIKDKNCLSIISKLSGIMSELSSSIIKK
jgi:uncharacterized protein (DUF302 family)